MPAPTVQEFNDGKTDLDALENCVNSLTEEFSTRLGGNKLTLSGAVSKIVHGAISAYSSGTTYTDVDVWVEESGIVYRPLLSALPIGPESFNSSKWIVVQGWKIGDKIHPPQASYANLRAVTTTGLPDGTVIDVTNDGIAGNGVMKSGATANAITGITQANPAVVTYSGADNWSNGDRVYIQAVAGMTEVNDTYFTVANVNTGANTFELSGIDSTAYTAYTSGGHVSFDNGGTLIVFTDDSNRYWERVSNGVADVDHFEPNGVNDTVAIQAALDTGYDVIGTSNYTLTTTPILKNSRQKLHLTGLITLNGASGTAALQIGDPGVNNVDECEVFINTIDGQTASAGRDGIQYRYCNTSNIFVTKINNCRYGHHARQTVNASRFVHNDIRGIFIRACDIGIYHQAAPGGVTVADNEGNDYRVNLITGSNIAGMIVESGVQPNGSLVYANFDAGNNYYVNASEYGQPNILICTDWPEPQSATGGTTDGSTAVITGLSDTSVFIAGCYVKINSGFPSANYYKVVSVDSGTQITVDTNSSSVVSGSVTVTREQIYATRDVVLGDGLFQMGRRSGRNTQLKLDCDAAQSNLIQMFRGGVESSRIGHSGSSDLVFSTGSSASAQLDLLGSGGVRLRNRVFFNGNRDDTLAAGNSNDVDPSSSAVSWRITANASGSTITGIAGGSGGRILKIFNVSSNSLTLAHDNSGSGSGNRILSGTGADIVMGQNDCVTLSYDSTSSRWRVESIVT